MAAGSRASFSRAQRLHGRRGSVGEEVMAEAGNGRERPAVAGELCVCGRPATVVFEGGQFGPTGWCGRSDGGARGGLCPFCGGQRHGGRCPIYTLRGLAEPTGLLLVCTDCEHAWEPGLLDPSDRAEAMSIGCPRCGGWVWIGQLAEPGEVFRTQSTEIRDEPNRRRSP
jgi:hypothetical protein